MAETKEKVEKTAEVITKEESPMDYVPYLLRRDPRRQDKGMYASVNQLRVFVPYGQQVMIPRCIAEVIDRSIAQDEATAQKIMALGASANY